MITSDDNFQAPHRILIIGASGLLGSRLLSGLKTKYTVLGTRWRSQGADSENLVQLNFTKSKDLDLLVDSYRPDVVINCSGLTSVDECEVRPEAAWILNALSPAYVAESLAKRGIRFVHISTDHFESSDPRPRAEDTIMTPINQYGISKLSAEEFILSVNPLSSVIRTNFFGLDNRKKKSILDFAVSSLSRNQITKGAQDVTFTPIGVSTLVEFISEFLLRNCSGIFHVAGKDELSKFEFLRMVGRLLGVDEDRISPARMTDFGLVANRPSYLSLDGSKVSDSLGWAAPSLESMLQQELSMMGSSSLIPKESVVDERGPDV